MWIPTAPDKRVTLIHEKGLARISGGGRIVGQRRTVQAAEEFAASVVHLHEQLVVPFSQVGRLEDVDVRRVLDHTLGVAWRQLEVSDHPIARFVRVELSVSLTAKLLISSHHSVRAEAPASERDG